jgi:hypothetical protein
LIAQVLVLVILDGDILLVVVVLRDFDFDPSGDFLRQRGELLVITLLLPLVVWLDNIPILLRDTLQLVAMRRRHDSRDAMRVVIVFIILIPLLVVRVVLCPERALGLYFRLVAVSLDQHTQHADFVAMRVRTLSRSATSADCVLEGTVGTKGFSFDVIAPGTAETLPAGGGWTCGRWVGVGARARACYSARVATVASCLVKTQTAQAATSWWVRVILADDIADEARDGNGCAGSRIRISTRTHNRIGER